MKPLILLFVILNLASYAKAEVLKGKFLGDVIGSLSSKGGSSLGDQKVEAYIYKNNCYVLFSTWKANPKGHPDYFITDEISCNTTDNEELLFGCEAEGYKSNSLVTIGLFIDDVWSSHKAWAADIKSKKLQAVAPKKVKCPSRIIED